MKCESEKASFEAAQSAVSAAKDDLMVKEATLKVARDAYNKCMGQGTTGDDTAIHKFFDLHNRIRTSKGSGSGNLIEVTNTHYLFETNYHVAGGKGSRAIVDIWQHGDAVGSYEGVVSDAWFKSGASVDISIISIPKERIPVELTPVPTASEANDPRIEVGSHLFVGGCMQGLTPRPRSGDVVRVSGGLYYYTPQAIGGDSGSPVLALINGVLHNVGRTAWSVQMNGVWYGLAMSWERILQIKRGEVSAEQELPPDTYYPEDEIVNLHVTKGV